MSVSFPVSAENIVIVSLTPQLNDCAVTQGVPPSADYLKAEVRARFMQRVHRAEDKAQAAGATDENKRRATKAHRDLRRLDQLFAQPPAGFAVVPVWHAPIFDEIRRRAVFNEYAGSVLRPFLKYLAYEHAAALQDLGICRYGIDQMRQGLSPCDAMGRPYDVDVDHIVERCGAGALAMQRQSDALNRERLLYPVNHFGNLILLPGKVHHLKNALMHLQMPDAAARRKAGWVLSLVPVRSADHKGFVCPPQPQMDLAFKPHAPLDCIRRLNFCIKQALAVVHNFKSHPGLRADLKAMRAEAAGRGRLTVAEYAQGYEDWGLAARFQSAVQAVPDLNAALQMAVRPALRDIMSQMRHVFDESYRSGKAIYKEKFLGCIRGASAVSLRHAVQGLPLPEAATLEQLSEHIERCINQAPRHVRMAGMGIRAA